MASQNFIPLDLTTARTSTKRSLENVFEDMTPKRRFDAIDAVHRMKLRLADRTTEFDNQLFLESFSDDEDLLSDDNSMATNFSDDEYPDCLVWDQDFIDRMVEHGDLRAATRIIDAHTDDPLKYGDDFPLLFTERYYNTNLGMKPEGRRIARDFRVESIISLKSEIWEFHRGKCSVKLIVGFVKFDAKCEVKVFLQLKMYKRIIYIENVGAFVGQWMEMPVQDIACHAKESNRYGEFITEDMVKFEVLRESLLRNDIWIRLHDNCSRELMERRMNTVMVSSITWHHLRRIQKDVNNKLHVLREIANSMNYVISKIKSDVTAVVTEKCEL